MVRPIKKRRIVKHGRTRSTGPPISLPPPPPDYTKMLIEHLIEKHTKEVEPKEPSINNLSEEEIAYLYGIDLDKVIETEPDRVKQIRKSWQSTWDYRKGLRRKME